jgi:hypothetical protein
LRLVKNRDGSPIAARNDAAQIRFTPDTVISRRISGQSRAWRAISQPPAARHAEQVSEPRLGLQSARQHRLDLILGSGPPAHQLLTTREAAAQHLAALIGHPHRVELPFPQQSRQRPGVELVSLCPGA